jgi:hypothetical protein
LAGALHFPGFGIDHDLHLDLHRDAAVVRDFLRLIEVLLRQLGKVAVGDFVKHQSLHRIPFV